VARPGGVREAVAASDEDNFAGIQTRSWRNAVVIGLEDHHALKR